MRNAKLLLFFFVAALFAAGTALSGCNQQAIGISPHPEKLHYPLGIAVHPSGKYLYAANTNFDLAFTGGSVIVFETEEKETDTFDIKGVKTELKTLKPLTGATVEIGSFAGQMVIDAEGKFLYTAVRQGRQEGGSVPRSAVVFLKISADKKGAGHLQCSQYSVKKEEVGGVGDAGRFEYSPPPRCGDKSKVFLPKDSYPFGLTLLQRCRPKRSCQTDADCRCDQKARAAGLCSADQKCDFGRCIPGCTKGACPQGQVCHLGRCRTKVDAGKKCNQDSDCPDGERCDFERCVPGCKTPGDCPTGYTCQSGRCLLPRPPRAPLCQKKSDCPQWETCRAEQLFVTFLGAGGLGYIDLTEEKKTYVPLEFKEMPTAVSAAAIPPPHLDFPLTVFFTSKNENKIFHFTFPIDKRLSYPESISLLNAEITRTTDYDLRGIAVGASKDKKLVRLFAAVRNPYASVAVFRLKYQYDEKSGQKKLSAVFEKAIPTGYGVSFLLYRPRPAPLSDLLYAVSTRDRRIYLIDAETLQSAGKIYTGESPYFMAIFEPDKNSKLPPRGYVTNFLESTISIIDLNTHRVIGKIKGFDTRQPIR